MLIAEEGRKVQTFCITRVNILMETFHVKSLKLSVFLFFNPISWICIKDSSNHLSSCVDHSHANMERQLSHPSYHVYFLIIVWALNLIPSSISFSGFSAPEKPHENGRRTEIPVSHPEFSQGSLDEAIPDRQRLQHTPGRDHPQDSGTKNAFPSVRAAASFPVNVHAGIGDDGELCESN